MRYVRAVAAYLLLGSCLGASPALAWTKVDSERVDGIIKGFMARQPLDAPHSMTIALGLNGTLLYSNGFGEAAPGVPAHDTTVYHVGSLTKQFTAAAVLNLIDEQSRSATTSRRLTLDSEVADMFEGFEHWTKGAPEPVTIRRLLNMTSNLPNFTRRPPSDTDPWGTIGASDLLTAMRGYAPHGWPDSFEYSNTSYFVLAEILGSSVSDGEANPSSYKTRLRALFDKAAMPATGFMGDYAPGTELAKPHYDRQPAFIKGDWLMGSGDVASNALDIFAWNVALMQGRVLRAELREQMFGEGGRITPTVWYGMGFVVEHKADRDEYTHTGAVPGYSSFNGIYRQQNGSSWSSVTLLTNSGGFEGLDALASELADFIEQNKP